MKRRVAVIAAALFAVINLAAETPSGKVCARGIDISRHNRVENWDSVAANVDFIFIKATEGATYTDPAFADNIMQARKRGIPAGAYHYFRTTSSGKEQFANFLRNAGQKIDLIPVVDVEEAARGAEKLRRELEVFVAECIKTFGVAPIIYAAKDFYTEFRLGDMGCPMYWCGHTDPAPPDTAVMHQYAITQIPGMKGGVDRNHLFIPIDSIRINKSQ